MQLEGKTILQLVHNNYEDLELWYPVIRLREAGAEVLIAGEKNHTEYFGKYGLPVLTDRAYSEINPDKYDGLLIPGGWAPDKIRRFEEVITIIKFLDKVKKPIGQICHGGWVLISAGILKGKKVTSTPAIRDDMENAGAIWEDNEVVVDGHIVSSRTQVDLPFYVKKFIEVLLRS